jgi:S-adenosylmethionine hydrolase
MSETITLTTDFGHKGPFVAVMKGVILTRAPGANIIDLTHEILVHWPAEAGFWLSKAYRYFPRGTVHVAVVDPGVGTERNIIAARFDGHTFLAPDNGLLASVFDPSGEAEIYRMDDEWHRRQNWPLPSNTFHGRDIFAPLAAEMAAGRLTPADIGPRATDTAPSPLEQPTVKNDRVYGSVVTIDHFGNLITNIDEALVKKYSPATVQVAGQRLPLSTTYGVVQPGNFLALINSFGVVEIARAEGNAASGLGLGRGAPVIVGKA